MEANSFPLPGRPRSALHAPRGRRSRRAIPTCSASGRRRRGLRAVDVVVGAAELVLALSVAHQLRGPGSRSLVRVHVWSRAGPPWKSRGGTRPRRLPVDHLLARSLHALRIFRRELAAVEVGAGRRPSLTSRRLDHVRVEAQSTPRCGKSPGRGRSGRRSRRRRERPSRPGGRAQARGRGRQSGFSFGLLAGASSSPPPGSPGPRSRPAAATRVLAPQPLWDSCGRGGGRKPRSPRTARGRHVASKRQATLSRR